ncbi:MAG: enoyl-CoA hydratase/isomerase family protein [Actinobacteria bacterium]|nr:enoyl-CoA hydratase/isomerase family protein [Actinomycetota bacterium]
MAELPIRVETRGAAVHVLFDRPEKANAIDAEMWQAIPDIVAHAQATPGARCLVISSVSDGIFSAGADVSDFDSTDVLEWGLAHHRMVTAASASIADSGLVSIARVTGPCAGGAVALAVACDFRFAADSAVFVLPPARLGLIYPQADTTRLVKLIGPSATKRLLFTAAHMDARWALKTGLVDEVHRLDDLDAAVDQIVAQVEVNNATSIRAMKQTVAAAAFSATEEDPEVWQILKELLAERR